jgi:hypothetical protein
LIALGAVPAAPSFAMPTVLLDLGRGIDGVRLHIQGVHLDASTGEALTTTEATVILLDAAF